MTRDFVFIRLNSNWIKFITYISKIPIKCGKISLAQNSMNLFVIFCILYVLPSYMFSKNSKEDISKFIDFYIYLHILTQELIIIIIQFYSALLGNADWYYSKYQWVIRMYRYAIISSSSPYKKGLWNGPHSSRWIWNVHQWFGMFPNVPKSIPEHSKCFQIDLEWPWMLWNDFE